MTEADAKRSERRQDAIKMRLKREVRLAAEFAKLPPSVKRRKVRKYGRSKAKLHIEEYLPRAKPVGPPPTVPPLFEAPALAGITAPEVEPKEIVEPVKEAVPVKQPVTPKKKPVAKPSSPIDVLFLSHVDYACAGHLFAESLKSTNVNAVSMATRYSAFRAPKDQGSQGSDQKIEEAVEKAKILVWMHSYYRAFPEKILKGKRLMVFHGGTRYRRNPKKYNARFNPIVEQCLIQTGELLGRGAKNQSWLLPPVDTAELRPNYTFRADEKLVIGHFTSHIGRPGSRADLVKGTPAIRSVIESIKKGKLGGRFVFEPPGSETITWRENLRKMDLCDIYVESLSQGQEGNANKHDWSIAALEACALGCITVTNFIHEKRYEVEYGEHGLLVANTEAQLKKVLRWLLQLDRDELLALKHKARLWVEEMHSYRAIGLRLRSILGI